MVVKDDGDDVVAVRFVFDAEHLPVDARGTCDLTAFAQVDVDLRWREPIGRAGFYFNKAKNVIVVGNEIYFCINDCATQVSSDRQSEIGGDQTVAELGEVCGGVCFAEFT